MVNMLKFTVLLCRKVDAEEQIDEEIIKMTIYLEVWKFWIHYSVVIWYYVMIKRYYDYV